MSPQNSMSLDYEPIQQTQSAEDILETQSIECVLETETQEAVSSLEIYFPDDLTSDDDDDDDDPCDTLECTSCNPSLLKVQGGKPRLCVTCRFILKHTQQKKKNDQSIECVLETETQEEPPKTQESVSNLDIFFTDDLTSDDDEEPCSMAECTGCTLFFWGKERFCVTCRYYAQYE